MAITSFDKYFLHLPPLNVMEDFDSFWNKSIKEMNKIPINPNLLINKRKTSDKYSVFNVSFNGFMKTKINGELLIPRGVKKPKIIICIHDYNSVVKYSQDNLNEKAAYFFITLRGHDKLPKLNDTGDDRAISPGYMVEHILNIELYYAKAVYLDIFRSIAMLRLNSDLDCSNMGIIGKGFGAAAAIFTTAYSDRIAATVLDSPSFCYLSLYQNISVSDLANEINNFISSKKVKKKQLKKNLTYFDAINFTDKIENPVLATVGLKDRISPPECVFALFNRLLCEKVVEVYPDDGHNAGGRKQFKKSINWLIKKIIP